ncbi:MAG: hypothetical protein AAFN11_09295 [Chloroflexota bacterium]
MTLVVAYCDGKNLSCISDTGITLTQIIEQPRMQETKLNRAKPWTGQLKIIAVDSKRFIAFAGVVEHALNIINAIMALQQPLSEKLNTIAICQLIVNSVDTITNIEQKPDFIVGEVNQSSAILHEIKSGVLKTDIQASHLGSDKAFQA